MCHVNSSYSHAGYKPTKIKILSTPETFTAPILPNSYTQFLIFPSMSETSRSDGNELESKK